VGSVISTKQSLIYNDNINRTNRKKILQVIYLVSVQGYCSRHHTVCVPPVAEIASGSWRILSRSRPRPGSDSL